MSLTVADSIKAICARAGLSTAQIDVTGVASITPTANGTVGSYNITASVGAATAQGHRER